MALALTASLLFHTHAGFRQAYTSALFSMNKPVIKVNADVVGYTSYGSGGGRRGASTSTYKYGITYTVASQRYYSKADNAVTASGDYNAHIPLPRKFEIYVNASDPKRFTYTTAHYGMESFVNVPAVFYLFFLGGICVLCFGPEISWQNQLVNFNDYMALLMAVIFTAMPFYLVINANLGLYKGELANNIVGYTLIYKSPKSSATQKTYINMELQNPNGDNR